MDISTAPAVPAAGAAAAVSSSSLSGIMSPRSSPPTMKRSAIERDGTDNNIHNLHPYDQKEEDGDDLPMTKRLRLVNPANDYVDDDFDNLALPLPPPPPSPPAKIAFEASASASGSSPGARNQHVFLTMATSPVQQQKQQQVQSVPVLDHCSNNQKNNYNTHMLVQSPIQKPPPRLHLMDLVDTWQKQQEEYPTTAERHHQESPVRPAQTAVTTVSTPSPPRADYQNLAATGPTASGSPSPPRSPGIIQQVAEQVRQSIVEEQTLLESAASALILEQTSADVTAKKRRHGLWGTTKRMVVVIVLIGGIIAASNSLSLRFTSSAASSSSTTSTSSLLFVPPIFSLTQLAVLRRVWIEMLPYWRGTASRWRASLLSLSSSSSSTPTTTVAKFPTTTHHTLRSLLNHPDGFSLAMAPAFFGFYGYFGALAAWEEAFANDGDNDLHNNNNNNKRWWYQRQVQSVAGASAGAMAAILLAAGISPHDAIAFCTNVTLDQFADFPGVAAVFRGDKFEQIVSDFLLSSSSSSQHSQQLTTPLRLEQSTIPVAVSAFDLQTMKGQILTRGSMAKAARASATFPILFQPVPWREPHEDYLLIDGGVTDTAGLHGLAAAAAMVSSSSSSSSSSKRLIVNMVVGDFVGGRPPGPRALERAAGHLDNDDDDDNDEDAAVQVLSISIHNLPQCGPWAMKNGPKAVEAARRAMLASLDQPLVQIAKSHLSIRIDAGRFIPQV